LARLNIILILIALASALSAVSANHRARKLYTELESTQKRMRDLDIEWGQLQLEQSTLAAHVRIAKAAREKLGMKPPAPGQIISVDAAAEK
jgi:cell division protein FtsL